MELFVSESDLLLVLNASKCEDEDNLKQACDLYIAFASKFMNLRNQVQNNSSLNAQHQKDIHFQITQLLTFAINKAEHLEKRLKSNVNSNSNNNSLSKPIALHYLFYLCDKIAEVGAQQGKTEDATKYYTLAAEYGLELIRNYKIPFQSEVKTALSKAESLKKNNNSELITSPKRNNSSDIFNQAKPTCHLSVLTAQTFSSSTIPSVPNNSSSTSPSPRIILNNSCTSTISNYSSLSVNSTSTTTILERAIVSTTVNGSTPKPTPLKPLTDEEIEVLKYTSVMASGLLLYPWNDELDLNENFNLPLPFVDTQLNFHDDSNKHVLPLSKEQRSKLYGWLRPHEILALRSSKNSPQLIYKDEVNEDNIVQSHVVTDCSFVASLCVAALYERKYNKKLITNSIFPQNPKTNKPYYNPSGKYSIKIFLNGVARKVIIDDRLPVDSHGNLLCSLSLNPEEFWVSLMEKAYMKVNGGYQFPGSNSGIDLYALTGWIPEEVKISRGQCTSPTSFTFQVNGNATNHPNNNSTNMNNFDKDLLWRRMYDGFQLGKCLITISTGHLEKQTEEQLGLYANHAYAVLDVREVKVTNSSNNGTSPTFNMSQNVFNGMSPTTPSSGGVKKLIKVKNPWTRKRWKGPYSPNDFASWTTQLKKELDYDNTIAGQHDNGVFWMNYESLLKYFQTLHFSWSPDLFPYTEIRHSCWDHRVGPISLDGTDHHTMNGNPQFRLKLQGKGSVWIMLTKHFTSLDERDRDYLTFHVHRGSSASGETVYKQGIDRVFYNENTLIHKGRYSNDPHYRICLNSEDAVKKVTNDKKKRPSSSLSNSETLNKDQDAIFRIVLSQHEKIQTIRYSLFCYSTVPCTLEPIPSTYRYFKAYRDQWTPTTCGGSCNQISTYRLNPQYVVSAPSSSSLSVSPTSRTSPVNVTGADKTNLRFSCSTAHPLDINIMVFSNQGQPILLPAKEIMVASSGNYRRCFAMCKISSQELTHIQKTDALFPLTVVLSNFSGSLGDFEFRAESTNLPLEVRKVV
ncbi:hypothetical protein C9374_003130 [Naegleria lovaniensis]|uniref:Calpain catalytic domain-containing protein n=1 Tax=Naegleria lovaniensis TaxID=51637 RepID=A0AA88GPK6_NAELO|nr:uncharacterized protein C9374_003130 [Naegleria lovaniensis]KAG2385981.1 hypothetical protein C9374_003130 [Naegleria lovaniensis]